MTEMAPSGLNPPSATLNCPHCQTTITYYDVSESSYYGCPNCHAFFQYENDDPPQVLRSFQTGVSKIVLPIGAEGYLHNQFVRVVGFIQKREIGTAYDWSEYSLLQQNGQYIQLSEYKGHWMVIEPTRKQYKEYQDQAYFVRTEDRQYKIFSRYQVEVINAVGEFDWNILDDERLSIIEYIQPPYMLIHERDEKRSDWYIAHYLKRPDLATAFGLAENTLPRSEGVGAIEPSDANKDVWNATWAFTGLVLALVLLLQVVLLIAKPSKELFRESYHTGLDSAGTNNPIITSSFEVNGPTSLLVDFSADGLTNHWIELTISLINEQSGRTYEFTKALEYYEGVESGESWSEGSRSDDAVLSRIPSGRYHLNIYPATEPGQAIAYAVRVRQNRGLISNLYLLVLSLAIFPMILVFYRGSFEGRRWNNSNIVYEEK